MIHSQCYVSLVMSTLSSNARYHSTYNHIRPIKGVLKWFRSIFHFCDFVNLALEALVDSPTPEVVDSTPFSFQFFLSQIRHVVSVSDLKCLKIQSVKSDPASLTIRRHPHHRTFLVALRKIFENVFFIFEVLNIN